MLQMLINSACVQSRVLHGLKCGLLHAGTTNLSQAKAPLCTGSS